MIKFAKVAMLASSLLFPFAASAAPADGTYVGTVSVFKGIPLTCTLTAVVSGGGTQTTLSLSPGDFLCAFVFFNNQPYTVSSTSDPSKFTIEDVNVTTITPGDCNGDIDVTYDDGPPPTIAVNGSLPASSGGGACTVSGGLTKIS